MKRIVCSLALCLSLIGVAGCSTNPATGESSFTAFMSPAEERRLGAQEHPKLVRKFGGAYSDPRLQAYVNDVGQRLSRHTEMPDLKYSFTVLDNDLINAFALPGGYVHVTRGLMALASNEAELAGVLAHELGHISARHSAERYSQNVLASIGTTIVGAAGSIVGMPEAAQVAGFGAGAFLQSYSREQELEADMLGVRYMSRAGYDPEAMASFFKKLDRQAQLEATIVGAPGSTDQFNIMASHPRTGDRIVEAINLASAAPVVDPKLNANAYLAQIDGMVFGDSPNQGIRRGRDFAHPQLRIAFRVPPGFSMTNGENQVLAQGPSGSLMWFDMEPNTELARSATSMTDYVGRIWGGRLPLGPVETITVDGMDGATGATRIESREEPKDVRLVAIREPSGRIYRFVFLTPSDLTGALEPEFKRSVYGFRRLTEAEAAAVEPLRVKVVTVEEGDTAESLARQMPFESYRLERFLVLNGLRRDQSIRPGEKVKIIIE